MGLIASIFLGFLPALLFAGLIYWMDRYEKEPYHLLGIVFTWGAFIAAGSAFIINTLLSIGIMLFTGSEAAAEFTTTSMIAPLVEETLKGAAILLVFMIYYQEFDSILDGIVYAAITALGFAATENAFYIYNYGFSENGWPGFWDLVFIRTVLVGWQHPFYTAFFGIGLAAGRLARIPLLRWAAPLAGWLMAVSAHAVHNLLTVILDSGLGRYAALGLDWIGWLLMALFCTVMVYHEKQLLQKHLKEELELNNITPEQYRSACSVRARSRAWFRTNQNDQKRFYQVCAELAHKKNQLQRVGNEENNLEIIQLIRTEMTALSKRISSVSAALH